MIHDRLNCREISLQYIIVLAALAPVILAAFNDYHSEKIMLSEVKALTLRQRQMTNSRRSPPVPQLKCVGGSAQYKFQPKVVQCINYGSDGYDIQWECKTDMDNAYRFGHVEVTCEGYDYPNDPSVLKGSCGLEYTIEFTEEGLHRAKQKGSYPHTGHHKYSEGGLGGLLWMGALFFTIYVVYKACLSPPTGQPGTQQHPPGQPGTQQPPPGQPGTKKPPHGQPDTQQPPPYGFRHEFMPQGTPPSYESTQQGFSSPSGFTSSTYAGTSAPPPGNGGHFWTGAATGGLLGYLFGRPGNNYYNNGGGFGRNYGWSGQQHHQNSDNRNNLSESFFSSSSPSSGSSSSSSGTRTASGFGGTSRR